MSSQLLALLPALVAAAAAACAAWLAMPAPPRPGARRRESASPAPGRVGGPHQAEQVTEPRFGKATLRAAAAGGAGTAGLVLVPGDAAVGVACAAAALVWWRSRHWDTAGQQRRRERLAADLPHVVDLMVAALESGAAPDDALDRVVRAVGGPIAEELRVWLAHLRLGSEPVHVWAAMAAHPQLGRLGRALHRATESGAPVSAALVRLSDELRARARADVEAKVRQVEVKAAVPLALCLLPAFLLLAVVPLVAGTVGSLVLAP